MRIIDSGLIESRQFTNKAIVDILSETSAKNILDIGCGEGWLTRNITKMGKQAVGIDAVEELLINARSKGPEPFYHISYGDIINGKKIPNSPFDAAVFNFCLYQKDGLEDLFESTKKVLSKNGEIIIQTLHPYFLFKNGLEYKSQMVADSWKGLPGAFIDSHYWYARTFDDWLSVFSKCDMKVIELREIVNLEKQPISLILKVT